MRTAAGTTAEQAQMKQVWHSQDGVTAVEYGIITAFVGLAFVALGPWLADVMVNLLDTIVGNMQ